MYSVVCPTSILSFSQAVLTSVYRVERLKKRGENNPVYSIQNKRTHRSNTLDKTLQITVQQIYGCMKKKSVLKMGIKERNFQTSSSSKILKLLCIYMLLYIIILKSELVRNTRVISFYIQNTATCTLNPSLCQCFCCWMRNRLNFQYKRPFINIIIIIEKVYPVQIFGLQFHFTCTCIF